MPQISLWVSAQEAFYRRAASKNKRLPYQELIHEEHERNTIKSIEPLIAEGFHFQWFSYIWLRERCKIDNRTFGIEKQKTELEV